MSTPLELTLLGKPDCHLCHVMEAVITPVLAERGARLVVRDIRDDPALEQRYRWDIPVLLHGEAEIARHRIDAESLRTRLDAIV